MRLLGVRIFLFRKKIDRKSERKMSIDVTEI